MEAGVQEFALSDSNMNLNVSGTRTDLDKGKKQFRSVIEASKTIGVGTSKLKQIKILQLKIKSFEKQIHFKKMFK